MDENPIVRLKPGVRFHGLVIERLLGKGGLGAVYLARHEVLDTSFAVKVLLPGADQEFVKRFLREAKLATRLRHPNLVAVHDCGVDESTGLYFLTMDYVEGGDLRQEIALSGRVERDRALEIVRQVASALAEAERYGVVHRDIKPENIMIDAAGTVKVVDLGVAKADGLRDSLRTTAKTIFGTPAYISPEQAMDASKVDSRADVYSLGVVFYEMLSGECPYVGRTAAQLLQQVLSEEPTPDIRDVQPDVPAEYATLIRRMCVKDRDRRIAGMNAVLAEIERLRTGHRPAPQTQRPASLEAPRSMADYLHALPEGSAVEQPYVTENKEVQVVVDRLSRRRIRRKAFRIAAWAAAGGLLALLAWLVFAGLS